MNRLTREDRVRIVSALVEGASLRAISRMSDVSINTVTKLLCDIGRVCADFQDETLRDLPCTRIECDEIWAFVGAKDKTIQRGIRTGKPVKGEGSIWTWTAICADTKLVPSFMVGGRDHAAASAFMDDLASRLTHRVQLTTDGHKGYLAAVDNAFGMDVDYAMLIKDYGNSGEGSFQERRYSPSEVKSSETVVVTGEPDAAKVCTSYVERHNLTMRMGIRRFTRLTNGFSKKAENHMFAVALHTMHYNFCRVHASLRVTPAMAAGVADHVWTVDELIGLVERDEASAADVATRRGDRKAPVTVVRVAGAATVPRRARLTAIPPVALPVPVPKPAPAPTPRKVEQAKRLELREAHEIVRRTQDEKRSAVVEALRDPELCKLTSRRLGRQIFVSHTYVQNLRREFGVEVGQPLRD